MNAVDGARRLDDRIGQWLAALACDLAGEMLALAGQELGELAQDRDPLMRLQPVVAVAEDLVGRREHGFERRRIVGGDLFDRRAIIGLHDPQHGVILSLEPQPSS